ncbi:MAG TPA: N-acetylmuramidase domain-containing protein [Gemmatimonadales bacterium]|jgi:hypothetical protein
MRFQGSGRPLTRDGFYTALGSLRIGPAELWAVLTAESGGFGFTADRRPQLHFDATLFHTLTDGQWSASSHDLCEGTDVTNHGSAGDYRAFDAALDLDEEAAIASASWGIGGIAGFHATSIGFKSPFTMVAEMISAEDAQVRALTRRIAVACADDFLRDHDWTAFARRFKRRAARHDEFADRLESAYRRATRVLPDLTIRAAQAALLYAGFDPGPIDGIIGPRTLTALSEYSRVPRPLRGLFVGAGTLLRQTAVTKS